MDDAKSVGVAVLLDVELEDGDPSIEPIVERHRRPATRNGISVSRKEESSEWQVRRQEQSADACIHRQHPW